MHEGEEGCTDPEVWINEQLVDEQKLFVGHMKLLNLPVFHKHVLYLLKDVICPGEEEDILAVLAIKEKYEIIEPRIKLDHAPAFEGPSEHVPVQD